VYEYRPPTQSQNPNMLAVSIPNSATFAAFVDTATKCRPTAASSPSASISHARAVFALVIVSIVVKVLEQTMKRVSSASSPRSFSETSAPSTLDTNSTFRPRSV